ncbi:MAG: ABC transporter permease subunit [Candidatus Aminicenantes bacterium]|nr:ABC transporter permease subunit [Candidatus Aminicenantes bacterium]
MIFHIAKKEFLNNLLSARFVIGFLLCLVLIPFSILINVDDYRDQANQYRLDQAAAEKSLKEIRVYSALRPQIIFAPEPLGIFGKGISAQVGNKVWIHLGEMPLLAEGIAATRDNRFLASFFSIDFVDIAAIIFSLLALLFSFDALTREKENGTLRLQMANSLSRSKLLAGKVVGILMTLLPILVFCFLLGSVVILLSGDLSFTNSEWGRLAALAFASLIYLAVFIFIGLLVSSRTKSSVTSLVLCLFLWVLLVFIVPNLSSYFAESFVGIQSRDNLDRVLNDFDRSTLERIAVVEKNLPRPDWQMSWYMSSAEDGYRELYGLSASYFEWERQRASAVEPMRIDNADKKWGPQRAYLDSLDRQARAADFMAMISPAGIFRIIASASCGTDRATHQKRMDEVRRYRETFVRYLQGKNIFASTAYITPTPPSAFRTADALVTARTGGKFKSVKEYDDWASNQKDFRARWAVLGTVKLPNDRPDGFPYLTVDDMPRFTGRAVTVFGALEGSILRLGLILFESLILFALAYIAFIKYDVR